MSWLIPACTVKFCNAYLLTMFKDDFVKHSQSVLYGYRVHLELLLAYLLLSAVFFQVWVSWEQLSLYRNELIDTVWVSHLLVQWSFSIRFLQQWYLWFCKTESLITCLWGSNNASFDKGQVKTAIHKRLQCRFGTLEELSLLGLHWW